MTDSRRDRSASLPEEGRRRVVIEGVSPEIDAGRFPIKRVVGEEVVVEADVFADGHDVLAGVLRYRHEDDPSWSETPLEALVNDRWRARFVVERLGRYFYTLEGWVDPFATWRRDLEKKIAAGQDVAVELLVGAELVRKASRRTKGDEARALARTAARLAAVEAAPAERVETALDAGLAATMARLADRSLATSYPRELVVRVDRTKARFSTWYEMFPRSCAPEPGRHGTLRDAAARLDYVASMGFDVVYLPPIHPIGRTHRKGPNNAPVCGPDDPGSPWAIGGPEGGHKSIHPALGTEEDFRDLVERARTLGIEIALDIAFQCSPDHPYVREHPEWFRWRPDGTIQYAENPPKKYEDIYPFDFETEHWRELWAELKSVFLHWMDRGVRIFRVDNPHTKPFAFWEWVIGELQREAPDVILLSEAFTRPKIMVRLAKLGFTQSYTYFAWRNTSRELTEYFTELTRTELAEYFRPNLWPNTPDILTEYLQVGGRPAFVVRLVLAATLAASYGIYGPAFELMENRAREPGSEEYLDSEKYQIRFWDIDREDSLRELIARVNAIRRENPALQSNAGLRFHATDNDRLLCYSKSDADGSNVVIVVANLNPFQREAGWVELDLDELGLAPDRPFQVHDLLTEARYLWSGARNYVELDPQRMPAHVFRVRRLVRTEKDFDYYL